jgi:hypothetical protein
MERAILIRTTSKDTEEEGQLFKCEGETGTFRRISTESGLSDVESAQLWSVFVPSAKYYRPISIRVGKKLEAGYQLLIKEEKKNNLVRSD